MISIAEIITDLEDTGLTREEAIAEARVIYNSKKKLLKKSVKTYNIEKKLRISGGYVTGK